MDRYENNVSAAVHEFYNLAHPAFVILHLHKAAEYAHTVVYMHYIISKVEGTEVVKGELLGFFYAAAEAHTVEAVEYFMIGIDTYFVFLVYVSGMDVLFLDELGKDGVFVLEHDGAEAFQLGLLFTYYIYFIAAFPFASDIGNEKFEVLVENGLRGYLEFHRTHLVTADGNFHIYPFEGGQFPEERLILVHVRGVKPEGGIGTEKGDEADAVFSGTFTAGGDVGENIGLFYRFDGELGVGVEGVYPVHLVAEVTDAVGLFKGIGEYVDDGAAEGELPRLGDEVYFFEAFGNEFCPEFIVGKALPGAYREKGIGKLFFRRDTFFDGLGISDDEDPVPVLLENFADCRRPLDAKGGLVVASFHAFAAFGKKEDAVSFHHVVKVGRAVLCTFPCGKYNEMCPFSCNLG